MPEPLAPKQLEFVLNSTRKWNIAHGSVRSGKTVATLFRFMQACYNCPDSQIWMIGKTKTTIFENCVQLIINEPPKGMPDPLGIYRPFCTWFKGDGELRFMDKTISTLGAKDNSMVGVIQGKTISLCYCDEMTLYTPEMINMIDTRLSLPYSMGFASMNPSHPSHELKKWIDLADKGDANYYQLHFTLDDNPFVDDNYKYRIKTSTSGIFYKRNYLGLWCLAEGSIFDFFDRSLHVCKKKAPRNAEYWIAGIDYGATNAFACLLIGCSSGKNEGTNIPMMWVQEEYYWDSRKTNKQKTNFEYAQDVKNFLEPYGVKLIYMDPSAASFKEELRRMNFRVVDKVNNDVRDGIGFMSSKMMLGQLVVCASCPNLIREIESYVWDEKKAERGEEEPIKKDDHAIDAMRYACFNHKIASFDLDDYNRKLDQQFRERNWPGNRF